MFISSWHACFLLFLLIRLKNQTVHQHFHSPLLESYLHLLPLFHLYLHLLYHRVVSCFLLALLLVCLTILQQTFWDDKYLIAVYRGWSHLHFQFLKNHLPLCSLVGVMTQLGALMVGHQMVGQFLPLLTCQILVETDGHLTANPLVSIVKGLLVEVLVHLLSISRHVPYVRSCWMNLLLLF